MVDDPFKHRFATDPSLFPLLVDAGDDRVLVSALGEAQYRAASFLDQRILTDQVARQWMDWQSLPNAAEAPGADYIFHIGHVGSTLVSRLLGEAPDVLALREPLLLRTLAQAADPQGQMESGWPSDRYQARLAQVQGWLARRFRPDQRVVIKATSFVTAIADQLMEPDRRALFLYVPLDRYLETILAGPASRQETFAMAPARMERLHRLFPDFPARLADLPPVTRIAMSWLCEMATATQTLPLADRRHRWLDFEAFLSAPEAQLAALFDHFDLSGDAAAQQQLLTGPIMRQYSKAPEHGYSPALRRELQREAAAAHRAEIAAAMAWVEAMMKRTTSMSHLPVTAA